MAGLRAYCLSGFPEAVAGRHGWEIVEVFSDNGVSGASGRDKRPAFDSF